MKRWVPHCHNAKRQLCKLTGVSVLRVRHQSVCVSFCDTALSQHRGSVLQPRHTDVNDLVTHHSESD